MVLSSGYLNKTVAVDAPFEFTLANVIKRSNIEIVFCDIKLDCNENVLVVSFDKLNAVLFLRICTDIIWR